MKKEWRAAFAAAVLIACVTATNAAADGSTIADPVLSDAVHDALGVDRWEVLTEDQLASVTALTVDDLERGQIYDLYRMTTYRPGFYLDLSEIGCLPNLETLTIENNADSLVFGYAGLADCKNLRSLKVNYNVDQALENGPEVSGLKALQELVETCPSLEILDLVNTPSESVVTALTAINGDLSVNGSGSGAEEVSAAGEQEQQMAYGTLLPGVMTTDDITSCSDPESVISIRILGDCDLTALETMPNLRTVVISGMKSGLSYTTVHVTGARTLTKLPHLSTVILNLCELDADPSMLGEIEGLRTLGYSMMPEALPTDLPNFTNLTSFSYFWNDTELSDYLPAMESLICLYGQTAADLTLNPALRQLRLVAADRAHADGIPGMASFNGMEDLRYLSLENATVTASLDWTGFEGLSLLDVLDLNLYIGQPEQLSACQNLTTVSINLLPEITAAKQEAREAGCDLTEVCELPHLSAFRTGATVDADWIRMDLSVFSGFKGLKGIYDNDVVIDLISHMPAEAILSNLT